MILGKLIEDDSPLVRLPNELDHEQARLLTGIRINGCAAAAAWERVFDRLVQISNDETISASDKACAIADAWTVVDSFHLVRRFADQFQGGRISPTLGPFQEEMRTLRDDHQHRLERGQTRENRGGAQLGALHWVLVTEPGYATAYTLWPGRLIGQSLRHANPIGRVEGRRGIQGVELESFNTFARLSDAMAALRKFIRGLEATLVEQLGEYSHGAGDAVMKMHLGPSDTD